MLPLVPPNWHNKRPGQKTQRMDAQATGTDLALVAVDLVAAGHVGGDPDSSASADRKISHREQKAAASSLTAWVARLPAPSQEQQQAGSRLPSPAAADLLPAPNPLTGNEPANAQATSGRKETVQRARVREEAGGAGHEEAFRVGQRERARGRGARSEKEGTGRGEET